MSALEGLAGCAEALAQQIALEGLLDRLAGLLSLLSQGSLVVTVPFTRVGQALCYTGLRSGDSQHSIHLVLAVPRGAIRIHLTVCSLPFRQVQ